MPDLLANGPVLTHLVASSPGITIQFRILITELAQRFYGFCLSFDMIPAVNDIQFVGKSEYFFAIGSC